MVFNSIEFVFFLPVVYVLYWFVFNRNPRLQNLFLVIVSYIFYGWWNWKLMILLLAISLSAYLLGGRIQVAQTHREAKLFSAANIVIGVGALLLFKYYNFFAGEFADLFGIEEKERLLLKIALPAGISFYVFRSLSYTIDVYRGKIVATNDWILCFAYISFFPHLLSGPIARFDEMSPQLSTCRKNDPSLNSDGARQMLWGLFKKIVVADNCGQHVDRCFADIQSATGSTLLVSAILYSIQIYADFSGYSDMAIGCGKLLGISSPKNFDYPYFSRNIAEFWRRWHISLTSWFRDYVYIPLGGSRVPMWRVIFNTFVIFLLSGLWHGANWTFIIWGGYNALLFIPLILLQVSKKYKDTVVAEAGTFPTFKEVSQMLLTFVLVMLGFIIFRSESIQQTGEYLIRMFNPDFFTVPWLLGLGKSLFLSIVLMFFCEWLNRKNNFGIQSIANRTPIVKYAFYLVVVFLIVRYWGQNESFIYFNF